MHIQKIIKGGFIMDEETRVVNQATQAIIEREGKYLTFVLDEEEYGIGILKIKEIIGLQINNDKKFTLKNPEKKTSTLKNLTRPKQSI